jgi:hypothetical protein
MTAVPSDLRQLVEFSRTGYRTCAVFLMQDRDTQRVYRLCDINKSQLIPPDQAYCDAGNVNSADELYLVIESVRPDTKHHRDSSAPTHADGAGGSQRERAMVALCKVIDGGFLCASSLARDPWLESLHGAPGYAELAQKAERRRLEIHAAFLDAGGEQVLTHG